MRTISAGALVMMAIGLAGCGPEGPNKADTGLVVGAVAGGILGNQVGKGSGNVAATAIGAVVGGIVGSEIGRSMDAQDRRLAQEAEFDALERGQSGVQVEMVALHARRHNSAHALVPGAQNLGPDGQHRASAR